MTFRKLLIESNTIFYFTNSGKEQLLGTFNIIKDMHTNNFLSVKMKSGFTQPFSSNIGGRQGDTLKTGVHYKKRIKFHSVILPLDLKEVTSPVNQQHYHVWYF